MGQLAKDAASMQQESQPEITEKAHAKKRYASPRLVEYGSLAKLTHGAGSNRADAGSTKPCL